MPSSSRPKIVVSILLTVAATAVSFADDTPAARTKSSVAQLIGEYCVDCHGNDNPEANVNLEKLFASNYVTSFRTWEKVTRVLQDKRMPPEDMPQPTAVERDNFIRDIRADLDRVANLEAGDPGRVVMRRLTSAEYEYTIRDLTGLELDLASTLIGDAVGGEGFANVGDVQFVQD
ncbi:MAG: DUF1587 domain-containing protein [Planctomycetales bacterium]|nr:DUF1587 domain-containing protein [Planctomycetales bacterium]